MLLEFLKFNNEISIADISSFLAILISLITLVFLFVQRKDASKTNIYIDNCSREQYFKIVNKVDLSSLNMLLRIVGGDYVSNFHIESHLMSEDKEIEKVYQSHDSSKLFILKPSVQYDYIDKGSRCNLTEHFTAYVFAMGDYIYSQLKDIDSSKELPKLKQYNLYSSLSYADANNYNYRVYYRFFAELVMMKFGDVPELNYRIVAQKINKKTYKNIIKFSKGSKYSNKKRGIGS